MAKIIKRLRYGTVVEYEESDPIYSEGWTIGAVSRPKRQASTDKQVDTANLIESDKKQLEGKQKWRRL